MDMVRRINTESGSVLQRLRDGIQLTAQEFSLAMKRIYDYSVDIIKSSSCASSCTTDDVARHASTSAGTARRPPLQQPSYTGRVTTPTGLSSTAGNIYCSYIYINNLYKSTKTYHIPYLFASSTPTYAATDDRHLRGIVFVYGTHATR